MFKHHGFSPVVLYAFDLDFICNFQGQGQYGGIRYVGVNHNGINFLTRERSLVEDYLDVVEHHKLVFCNYLSVFIMIYSHWQKNFTFLLKNICVYIFSFQFWRYHWCSAANQRHSSDQSEEQVGGSVHKQGGS